MLDLSFLQILDQVMDIVHKFLNRDVEQDSARQAVTVGNTSV